MISNKYLCNLLLCIVIIKPDFIEGGGILSHTALVMIHTKSLNSNLKNNFRPMGRAKKRHGSKSPHLYPQPNHVTYIRW